MSNNPQITGRARVLFNDGQGAPDMTEVKLALAKADESLWIRLLSIAVYFSTGKIDTAGTDGVHIYINRPYWSGLTVSQQAFILGHEILHIILDHMGRGALYKAMGRFAKGLPWDHYIYNMSADYVINAYLVWIGLDMPDGLLFDSKYTRHHLTDEIYQDLIENQPEQPEQGGDDSEPDEQGDDDGQGAGDDDNSDDMSDDNSDSGQPDDGDDAGDDDQGDDDGQGDDQGDDDMSGDSGQPDSDGEQGQGEQGDDCQPIEQPSAGHDQHFEPQYDGTPEQQAHARELDRADNQQANDDMLNQPDMSAHSMAEVDRAGYRRDSGIDYQPIPWKAKLAAYFNKPGKGIRNTYARIHKRKYFTSGLVMPTKKGRLRLVAITEDTSGSILESSRDLIHKVVGDLIDQVKPTQGAFLMFVDDGVQSTHRVRNGAQLRNIDVPYGGCTYMSAGLDYMKRAGIRPDVHIVFTDGELMDSDAKRLKQSGAVVVLDRPADHWVRTLMEKHGIDYIEITQ